MGKLLLSVFVAMPPSKIKTPDPVQETETCDRLIQAGLEIFSQHTFEGATTRMIAEAAGVNLAAIPYYYGGKQGLYQAVVEHIFLQVGKTRMLPVVEAIQQTLEETPDLAPEGILSHLFQLMDAHFNLVTGSDFPRHWLKLAIGEMSQPCPVFEVMYSGVIRHVHSMYTLLISRYLGQPPESAEMIVVAHTLVSQIVSLWHTRETLLRRLGKTQFEPEDLTRIRDTIFNNVRSILTDYSSYHSLSPRSIAQKDTL